MTSQKLEQLLNPFPLCHSKKKVLLRERFYWRHTRVGKGLHFCETMYKGLSKICVLVGLMGGGGGGQIIKLMWLGPTNPIVVDSDSKAVDFDRRITSIRISKIKIESTIAIFDINRSKIDLFWLNRPFLIQNWSFNWSNVNYSIEFISKISKFDQILSNYIKNCWFWSSFSTFSIKFDHFPSNSMIFDINLKIKQIRTWISNIKSNSDMDFKLISSRR